MKNYLFVIAALMIGLLIGSNVISIAVQKHVFAANVQAMFSSPKLKTEAIFSQIDGEYSEDSFSDWFKWHGKLASVSSGSLRNVFSDYQRSTSKAMLYEWAMYQGEVFDCILESGYQSLRPFDFGASSDLEKIEQLTSACRDKLMNKDRIFSVENNTKWLCEALVRNKVDYPKELDCPIP